METKWSRCKFGTPLVKKDSDLYHKLTIETLMGALLSMILPTVIVLKKCRLKLKVSSTTLPRRLPRISFWLGISVISHLGIEEFSLKRR